MSEFDLSQITPVLQQYIPLGRSGLLPALHAAQKIYGWLPQEVVTEIAMTLHIPLADVHGVIEFYSLFYNKPVGKRIFRICTDPACGLKGGDDILEHLCSANHVSPNNTTLDQETTIERSPCLGLCEHAPAAMLNDDPATNINLALGTYDLTMPASLVYGNQRILTKNCGNGNPTTLRDYGVYSAFQRALKMSPESVIDVVKASGLVGRGGAAFPTGIKWEGARKAEGKQKYIVCNADESEPGTFKDRILLGDDPHLVIEGMCIAGHAVGATRGYIYLRGEYPYLLPVLENALAEARAVGYLNEQFDIEIRLGAGAYICGEETALFESIEGKRGFPRIKPPFPTTFGLFSSPTVINNVETLCNLPLIMEKGATSYRQNGTEKSPGTKLFCLSGDVTRPGLYEVPFGVTLKELLSMAGGVAGGTHLQAVLFGGAAGAFATPEHLDVKLTFEDLRAVGLPLGSGVLMVFDETRDLRDTLKRLGRFFAHESCGKCYPCQLGTQRQKEILDRLAAGHFLPGDSERLQDIGWTMTDASLCGLGQTAATAVLSAMKQFPGLFSETSITTSPRS
jgi:NADH-quinone oxidoreductase subunit F